MKTGDKGILVFVVVLMLAVLFSMGAECGKRTMRAKACKHGAGEYVVVDEYGNTDFQWVIPEQEAGDE